MLIFSERLKCLRKKNNITQKEAASMLEISERVLQSYEYGKIIPTATVIVKIAELFDVSLDYLCGRTDNPDLNNASPIKKSSVYVPNEDKALVTSCLALDKEDKQVVLATAKAMLSREKYSQLTRNPAG